MKRLRFILQKEFRQMFRDRTILAMMFMLPLIQLGILPLAMNLDVKHINLAIVDNDHSTYTQKLISKIGASGYFIIVTTAPAYKQALFTLENGTADIILEIPASFERNLIREGSQPLNVTVDAINGIKSGIGAAYLLTVIRDFNQDIRLLNNGQPVIAPAVIDTATSAWFNPYEKFTWYIVPGVLVLLLTLVGGFLSALNIVREKEIGTIEQINVTPVKKWQFILGKLVPFWVVGMIVLTVGLLVARLFYGIIPVGSLFLLYLLAAVYLIALLGFGLLVSTISNNQLQAMFIAFFFIMIFVLMSGLFTSVDSMPAWARTIAAGLPITHFMKAVRMIILKGSSFKDVLPVFIIEGLFAIGLNALAIWNYRKTQ
ncbi:ABC transporter permease [Niabella pedocola]|uniref:ABC transporter permease n=1 Tax=Niabella pedocola TaxID=1752077 RepID=A0ABS8PXG9_9BACT|nr:ABC transporter permease [Niabella pedocola]MCD2425590.1 ABC transporter permease [Niabella pedocola]